MNSRLHHAPVQPLRLPRLCPAFRRGQQNQQYRPSCLRLHPNTIGPGRKGSGIQHYARATAATSKPRSRRLEGGREVSYPPIMMRKVDIYVCQINEDVARVMFSANTRCTELDGDSGKSWGSTIEGP